MKPESESQFHWLCSRRIQWSRCSALPSLQTLWLGCWGAAPQLGKGRPSASPTSASVKFPNKTLPASPLHPYPCTRSEKNDHLHHNQHSAPTQCLVSATPCWVSHLLPRLFFLSPRQGVTILLFPGGKPHTTAQVPPSPGPMAPVQPLGILPTGTPFHLQADTHQDGSHTLATAKPLTLGCTVTQSKHTATPGCHRRRPRPVTHTNAL